MTEQKPVAWIYSYFSEAVGRWLRCCDEQDPAKFDMLTRNVRPLYEHPAPQPATDPAVEAARRKALRAIFAALDEYPWACDTCTVVPTGMARSLTYGILRDLVGQPRKYPDRAIRGYDNDGPPGPHPVFGKRKPKRLSEDDIVILLGNHTGALPSTLRRAARAIHEAVYGKDAE